MPEGRGARRVDTAVQMIFNNKFNNAPQPKNATYSFNGVSTTGDAVPCFWTSPRQTGTLHEKTKLAQELRKAEPGPHTYLPSYVLRDRAFVTSLTEKGLTHDALGLSRGELKQPVPFPYFHLLSMMLTIQLGLLAYALACRPIEPYFTIPVRRAPPGAHVARFCPTASLPPPASRAVARRGPIPRAGRNGRRRLGAVVALGAASRGARGRNNRCAVEKRSLVGSGLLCILSRRNNVPCPILLRGRCCSQTILQRFRWLLLPVRIIVSYWGTLSFGFFWHRNFQCNTMFFRFYTHSW